jgi:hypothetical protein
VLKIEPAFGDSNPICRELPTKSGSVYLVYVSEFGFITIAQCTLWSDTDAKRKVIGQVLDYAMDLAEWACPNFAVECLRARKASSRSLFGILHDYYPDIEEQ